MALLLYICSPYLNLQTKKNSNIDQNLQKTFSISKTLATGSGTVLVAGLLVLEHLQWMEIKSMFSSKLHFRTYLGTDTL